MKIRYRRLSPGSAEILIDTGFDAEPIVIGDCRYTPNGYEANVCDRRYVSDTKTDAENWIAATAEETYSIDHD